MNKHIKRIFIALIALLLSLTACDNSGGGSAIESNTSGVSASGGEAEGEALPELYTPRSSFYANGKLYYINDQFLRYQNLATGNTGVLCFDPLCEHNSETITTTCACPAVTFTSDGKLFIKDNTVYFTAAAYDGNTTLSQIRALDLETSELTILVDGKSFAFTDFRLLGDTVYLNVPEKTVDKEGRVTLSGGSLYKLGKNGRIELVYADTVELIGTSGDKVYFTGKNGRELLRSDIGFEQVESLYTLPSGATDIKLAGGYIYYEAPTGNKLTVESENIEGDFDTEVSRLNCGLYEYAVYRVPCGGGEAEDTGARTPLPTRTGLVDYSYYLLDSAGETLYYVPAALSYEGCIIWRQKPDVIAAFGLSGKDVLTKIFSQTGGRLCALDLAENKTRDILSDTGADIIDLAAVDGETVCARFELYDRDEIAALYEGGAPCNSSLQYRWNDAVSFGSGKLTYRSGG